LGECFAGALARSHTPQQERTRAMDGRGRAEITDLSLRKGYGRLRSRIRHGYRQCHSRNLSVSEDPVMGTWNMQGANWSRTEARHAAKFRCLVHEMRGKSIDVVCDGLAWTD